MGYERTIARPANAIADWQTIADRLKQSGESPVLRMIDGLPAFPDEIPEPTWRELRIGIAGQMITVKKVPDGVSCVCWGTDDPVLKAVFEKVVAAITEP